MKTRALLLLTVAVLLASGCGKKKRMPAPPRLPRGGVEVGIASWYGHPYHGRATASGEIYDMERLTAAHRTLPFSTWVLVENLQNGRMVEVRINDRGPFVGGRIIDLSHAAAGAIGMLGAGTAKVRLKVIAVSDARAPARLYAVQVGAFADRARAESLRKKMEKRYGTARIIQRPDQSALWRVLVGQETSPEKANELARRLQRETGAAIVVPLGQD
jgi:rare lipoprotein A